MVMINEGRVLIDHLGGSLNAVTDCQKIRFINQNFKCKEEEGIFKDTIFERNLLRLQPAAPLH